VFDPAGVTRTETLGSERMARKFRDAALRGGDGQLRAAVWDLARPMLSPPVVALNRDVFFTESCMETTVDVDGHREVFDPVAVADPLCPSDACSDAADS
jgi:hypothetical protein